MKLDENVNRFFDVVTDQLHSYIHHPNFKNNILKNIATSWRHKIDSEISSKIETEIEKWEETHVEKIYMDTFVKSLNYKLNTFGGNLSIGKLPHNQGSKNVSGSVALVLSFTMTKLMPISEALAGLTTFMYRSDFKTFSENAIDKKIIKLSTYQIKQKLRDRYETAITTTAKEAFENMKVEIDKLTEEIKERETENAINTSRMHIFMTINDMVCKCRQQLIKIENMCDAHDA